MGAAMPRFRGRGNDELRVRSRYLARLERSPRLRRVLRPMQSDSFSDLLRLTRARLVGTGRFAVRGTWGFRVAAPRQIVLAAVAHGSCRLRLEHHAPMRLEHGDVGLLSGRSSIVTANAPSGPTIDVPLVDKGGRIERMSDTRDCILLAGRIALDRANEALLSGVLPPYILVRASSPRAAGLRALVEQLLDEQTSALPGRRDGSLPSPTGGSSARFV